MKNIWLNPDALPVDIAEAARITADTAIAELGLTNEPEDVEWHVLGPNSNALAEVHPTLRDPFHIHIYYRQDKPYEALASVTHELVHVEQLQHKRLCQDFRHAMLGGGVIWEGKHFNYFGLQSGAFGHYTETPWEDEAYRKMFPLLRAAYRRFNPAMQALIRGDEVRAIATSKLKQWKRYYQSVTG